MSTQTKKAVAKTAQPGTAVQEASLMEEMRAYAGEGLGDARPEDKAIPFLVLLQQLSPQLVEGDAKYVADAKAGDIVNSVTSALYRGKEGVTVVPVMFRPVYNLWVPRDAGGGFLGSFEDPECKHPLVGVNRATEYDGPTQVVLTHNHFLLVQDPDGGWTTALLSMKSTQLKVSRRWNSEVDMKRLPTGEPAPRFAKQYRLTSVGEENDKGRYHNYVIADAGFVDAATFQAALKFRQQLQAGAVKVDYTKDEDVTPSAAPVEPEPGAPGF